MVALLFNIATGSAAIAVTVEVPSAERHTGKMQTDPTVEVGFSYTSARNICFTHAIEGYIGVDSESKKN